MKALHGLDQHDAFVESTTLNAVRELDMQQGPALTAMKALHGLDQHDAFAESAAMKAMREADMHDRVQTSAVMKALQGLGQRDVFAESAAMKAVRELDMGLATMTAMRPWEAPHRYKASGAPIMTGAAALEQAVTGARRIQQGPAKAHAAPVTVNIVSHASCVLCDRSLVSTHTVASTGSESSVMVDVDMKVIPVCPWQRRAG